MTNITMQQITTYGCILNELGKLLIIKRAAFDSSPNLWEIPGGRLELGESLVEGVSREVQEETGLTITPLYPLTSISRHITKRPFQTNYSHCLSRSN